MEMGHIVLALQILFRVLLKLLRLHQCDPSVTRQVMGDVCAFAGGPHRTVAVGRQEGKVDRSQGFLASLAGHVKSPDRLDFVIEQLDAHRMLPVRREHIEQTAAAGKFPR